MNVKLHSLKMALPEGDSFTLGLYRVLSFGWLFVYFTFENTLIGTYPLFHSIENPVGMYSFVNQSFFQLDFVRILYPIWLISLLLSCIGLFTRFSIIVALVLGYWIIGNTMAAGILSHQQFPHFLVLLIFACSESGRDFSLDKKLFASEKTRPDWEYRLPIFLLRSILILIFFSSAIAKIKNGGLLWFFNGDVSDMFARANLWFFGFSAREFFPKLNVFLVKNQMIGQISCVLVFIMEILSPLVVFKKFRWPLLSTLALFQIAATFALYVDFESFIGLYLFWIPLGALKGLKCRNRS